MRRAAFGQFAIKLKQETKTMIIIIAILLYIIAWTIAPEIMQGLHVLAAYIAIFLAVVAGVILLVAA